MFQLLVEVTMITSSHNFQQNDKLIIDQGVMCKLILFGDNVWIGSNATIVQSVTNGENSVIGTNALVNKNIPSNVIAAGVSCKVIIKEH